MSSVSIFAIAKDEAPYLHEWIHHHLFSGFSNIFIAINRTSDNSINILKSIKKHYNNVHFEIVDWIDMSSRGHNQNIQKIAYAYLTEQARKKYNPDYFFYVDVDEFWFSTEELSIKQYLKRYHADIHSFHWYCQYGEDKPFSPPFSDVIGSPHGHVKTILSKKAIEKTNSLRCHIPLIKKEDHLQLNHLTGKNISAIVNYDTDDFIKEVLKEHNINNNSAYILHRMIRSESEYLSNVFRGNPEGEKIKRNRSGYYKKGKKLQYKPRDEYYKSLENFIKKCNLQSHIESARSERNFNNKIIFDIPLSTLNSEIKNAISSLHGSKILDDYINRIIYENNDYSFILNIEKDLYDINPDITRKILRLIKERA